PNITVPDPFSPSPFHTDTRRRLAGGTGRRYPAPGGSCGGRARGGVAPPRPPGPPGGGGGGEPGGRFSAGRASAPVARGAPPPAGRSGAGRPVTASRARRAC